MMKKLTILFLLMLTSINLLGQKRRLKPLLWTTHSKNTDITGISIGLLPKEVFKDTTLTRTFGTRIEAPGFGILFPLIPKSPVSTNIESFKTKLKKTPNEIVYGFNISSGSNYDTEIHGVSLALIGQYLYKINGLTIAGLGNLTERYNGITISGIGNDSYKTNGIAIAFIGNHSQKFNGIQISAQNYIETEGIGLQIGLLNEVKNFKGIQIGLWNKNSKRSFPFINWNFKN